MKENFIRRTVKIKCQRCHGEGELKTTRQVIAKLGSVDILNECPNCDGKGHKEQIILLRDKNLRISIKK